MKIIGEALNAQVKCEFVPRDGFVPTSDQEAGVCISCPP